MKYLVLLGLVEILISTVNIGFTSFEDIYNDGHRHLPKDQIHMKIVEDTEVSYDYKVDEDSFDKIHPPIRFDEERFSASSGQLVGSIGLGSATIISTEENEEKELRSEILTAAHMVKKNQIVDFPIIYQGRTSFENGNIAYLAKHEVDEVCFNPNSDKYIALLKAEITENNIGDELFDKSANIVLQSFFSNPFKTMRGYRVIIPLEVLLNDLIMEKLISKAVKQLARYQVLVELEFLILREI